MALFTLSIPRVRLRAAVADLATARESNPRPLSVRSRGAGNRWKPANQGAVIEVLIPSPKPQRSLRAKSAREETKFELGCRDGRTQLAYLGYSFPQKPMVRSTRRWRDMDSNYSYRGTKVHAFRSIPGPFYFRPPTSQT